jgi:uncharacterized protein (UPF0297 family)
VCDDLLGGCRVRFKIKDKKEIEIQELLKIVLELISEKGNGRD